jgi:hypothetical protein
MERIAGELSQLSTDLATYRDELQRVQDAARSRIEEIFVNWGGPRADAELDRAFALLDEVSGAPGAIGDQIAMVDAASRFASELVSDLESNERWLSSTEALLARPSPEGISALIDDRRAATDAIAEIGVRWKRACADWFATKVPEGTAVLRAAKELAVAPLPGYPVPKGFAYLARLSEFSVEYGYSFDQIDPTGKTEAAADAMVGALLASPDGQIVLTAIEAAKAGEGFDQNMSENDPGRATDPEAAEAAVRRTLAELGITDVDEATVGQLVMLAQQSGWILQATWDDDVNEAVDDQLEAWAQPGAAAVNSNGQVAGVAIDVSTEVIPAAIEVTAPNLRVTEGLTAGELAGRFGLGADAIMTVGDIIVNGEDAVPALLTLGGETLAWSVLPSSAPVIVFGGVAIFLGFMWVADQAPTFYPDWSGMGAGPGQTPADAARTPHPAEPQLAPNGANPSGNLSYFVDCRGIDFHGGSHPACPDTGGLTPAGD